ncbi:MAG TPA: amino acid permease [Steroidobacteraceae bacterium]|nr:amino acid permease [Steroidobacteraceae bacterium]
MNTPVQPETGLQQGTLTWFKVASLGVAIAISGNFSGWNYGLGIGGLGGMFAAALAMALLFFCLTQCVAETAAALANEVGFDGYTRAALGPSGGYMCGMAVAIALAVGAGLALSFIEAYASASMGFGGWELKAGIMIIVIALQLRGARDAVALTMVTGAVAVAVLTALCLFAAPTFRISNWMVGGPGVANAFFPHGVTGAVQCIPYALFLFLGVEQAAHAASEMKDMTTSLPKALITAIGIAAVIGISVLLLATGSAGVARLSPSNDPLLTVVGSQPASPAAAVMTKIIGLGALFSLIATFFSLIYAGSRQFYHLSRAGDLPRWIALTNRRHAPASALALVALIGMVAAAFPPDAVMVVFIFLISVSHLLLIVSFIRLRRARPELVRPFEAIGGEPMAWLAGVLSCSVMASCYGLQTTALSWTIAALVTLFVYFRLVKLPQLSSRDNIGTS